MEQLPASLSASEFQGAGRQAEAKVFTIMCASLSLSLSLSLSPLGKKKVQ